ncbi:MAG: CoA transferase [Burkholderiaceae bacterium]
MMNPAMTTTGTGTAALHGVRVLDLTSVLFGPYCSMVLGDYGADVIKVEAPAGDSTRYTGPAQEPGLSAIFLGVNRNKRSIVLDLKQPAAIDALLRLVDEADVLMHSMRPQKMEKLGLGPAALCARNPRLIYAGLYGFGEGGDYAGQPAYDDVIQGLSGVAAAVGQQSGAPGYAPSAIADKTCGLIAAHAILAALFQRERSGVGQQIEVPMFESMTSFMLVEHFYGRHMRDASAGGDAAADDDVASASRQGPASTLTSTRHDARPTRASCQPAATPTLTSGYPRVLAPWRKPYPTRDGHLCVMPYTDRHWQAFFREAGRHEEASDPRFASIAERTRHIDVLYALLGSIIAQESTDYWLDFCQRFEIPAGRVNALDDLRRDPHLNRVGFFTDIVHEGHHYTFTRNPVTLSGSKVAPTMPPPLGAHTRDVLHEAGFSGEAIDQLFATRAAGLGG